MRSRALIGLVTKSISLAAGALSQRKCLSISDSDNWDAFRTALRNNRVNPMKKVKALVLAGNGINCETEMAHACKLGGADVVDIVYIYDLLSGEMKLDDYHFLNLPGGFLDGDDLGSAKAMAHRMKYARIAGSGERMEEAILRFIREGKLILGVCNGFQLMVKAGLLPATGGTYGKQIGHFDLQRFGTVRRPLGVPEGQPRKPFRLHQGAGRALPARPARRREIYSPG